MTGSGGEAKTQKERPKAKGKGKGNGRQWRNGEREYLHACRLRFGRPLGLGVAEWIPLSGLRGRLVHLRPHVPDGCRVVLDENTGLPVVLVVKQPDGEIMNAIV